MRADAPVFSFGAEASSDPLTTWAEVAHASVRYPDSGAYTVVLRRAFLLAGGGLAGVSGWLAVGAVGGPLGWARVGKL